MELFNNTAPNVLLFIIHYGKEDVKEHSLKNRDEPYTWNRPALHPTSAS